MPLWHPATTDPRARRRGLATRRWLEPGDVVEVAVEGIGLLRNEVSVV